HGHGHGIWQLDDRSHAIPPGFDRDPVAQAHAAASMLQHLHQTFGSWERALNAYNSGHPDAAHTTGHNYGPDVMNRLHQIDATEPADQAGPRHGHPAPGHTAPHGPGHAAPHGAPHGHTAPHGPGHAAPHGAQHGHTAPHGAQHGHTAPHGGAHAAPHGSAGH